MSQKAVLEGVGGLKGRWKGKHGRRKGESAGNFWWRPQQAKAPMGRAFYILSVDVYAQGVQMASDARRRRGEAAGRSSDSVARVCSNDEFTVPADIMFSPVSLSVGCAS